MEMDHAFGSFCAPQRRKTMHFMVPIIVQNLNFVWTRAQNDRLLVSGLGAAEIVSVQIPMDPGVVTGVRGAQRDGAVLLAVNSGDDQYVPRLRIE